MPLFQDSLFNLSSETFFCVMKGPSSSIAPYPIEEHPGPENSYGEIKSQSKLLLCYQINYTTNDDYGKRMNKRKKESCTFQENK